MKTLHELEQIQRGSLDFPLDYHYVDSHHVRYQMPYHWHNEHEIIHLLSGTLHVTLDDRAFDMAAGDVLYIPTGAMHGGTPKNCTYECVVFDMRLLLKCNDHCKMLVGDVINRTVHVNPFFPEGHKVIRHTIPPMFEALRSKCPGAELITLGCLFQFLGEVYKHDAYTREEENEPDGRRIVQLRDVFETIESEYASDLTLAKLAAKVHMTPKYFCRIFKEATHWTPMSYLNYYRIEMACCAMAATDRTVTEIAQDVGFADINYFIRAFKKHKGVTPGKYMRQLRLQA